MSEFGDIVNHGYTESHYTLYYSISDKHRHAINRVLGFALTSKGAVVDETIDLYLVLHGVVSDGEYDYSLDEIESILSMASELAIVNYIKDKQSLHAIEVGEDAPVYAAATNEDDLVLETALCLSENKMSKFNNKDTLAALSLFGVWENRAVALIKSLLDSRRLHMDVTLVRDFMESEGIHFSSDLSYVDCLRKFHSVGLINIKTHRKGIGEVVLNVTPAGFLLTLSENIDMARKLSDISG